MIDSFRRCIKMKKGRRCQIEVSFHVPESLYGEFKQVCKDEKQLPASVLKNLMMSFIDQMQCERAIENEKNVNVGL